VIAMTDARDAAIASYEARRAALLAEARDDILHRRPLTAREKRRAAHELRKAALDEEIDAMPDFKS
jgi:hypothetical protein